MDCLVLTSLPIGSVGSSTVRITSTSARLVLAPARVVAPVELGCRPVFVGVVAQGQYRAVDAGEQVRRRLIAIAFATGYVPCGDDDRVAGAVSGVVLCTGLSGGLGGMPGASLGGGLFGGLIRSGILRTAADGQEDGQCEAPNHDRCDPPSAHGYHRFSFAFVRCSLSTVGEIEVSLKREGEGPERQEARGRADQHQSVTTKLMCGTHLPTSYFSQICRCEFVRLCLPRRSVCMSTGRRRML